MIKKEKIKNISQVTILIVCYFFLLRKRECMSFVFFFQAEDGIRDYKVTGVQTCALPISRARRPTSRGVSGLQARHRGASRAHRQCRPRDRRAAPGELGPVSRRAPREARRAARAAGLVAASDAAGAVGEPRECPLAGRGVGRAPGVEER